MTDKVAAVKLTLNRSGFISGISALEKQVSSTGQRMGRSMSAVGSSIKTWTKDAQAFAKVLPALMSAGNSGFTNGMLNGLKTLESRSLVTAQRIGRAFRGAFDGGSGPIGGGVGRRRGADGRFLAGSGGSGDGGPTAFGIGLATNAIGMARDVAQKIAMKGLEITQEAGKTREAAMQLSVNSRQSGSYVDPKQLEREFYSVSSQVKGITADQAAEAATKFVTLTGDLDTARASLVTFATVSKATGADMGSVAEATASISRQFKLTDPGQIKEVLGALVYQGKKGSIMMPELATGLQRLAAAGSAFGLSGSGGVRTLGGLTQIAKTGTGSPEQAFTAVERVIGHLTEQATALRAQHVQVYEGKGSERRTRNIPDILIDAISKVGGKNVDKKNAMLQSMFGEEGIRALKPMIATYQQAYSGLGGGLWGKDPTDKERKTAGVDALKKMFDEAINAGGSWKDVVQDASMMQTSSSAQLSQAYEQMKSKIADGVLPIFSRLVTKLSQQTDAVDLFVKGVILMAKVIDGVYQTAVALKLVKNYKNPEETIETRNKHGIFQRMQREDFVGSDEANEMTKDIDDLPLHEAVKKDMKEKRQNEIFDQKLAKQKEMDAEGARLKEVAELQKTLDTEDSGRKSLKDIKPPPTEQQLTGGASAAVTRGAGGALKIDHISSTVKVEIVSDRTSRAGGGGGGAGSPTPGNVPRK